jgi:broad specificity phosphatase PhoE
MTTVNRKAWLMRHPKSVANAGGLNGDDLTPLAPEGLAQVPLIFDFIQKNDIEHVVCSPADRTFGAMMESWNPDIKLSVVPFFGEWKRADKVKKLLRTDPLAIEVKRRRLEEFGPDFIPYPGEETWEQTLRHLYYGFQYVQELECDRSLVLMHRHRAMQAVSYVLAGGVQMRFNNILEYDAETFPQEFVSFFKAFDRIVKFNNTDYLELVYKKRFGSDEECWNWDVGQKLRAL